MHISAIDAPSDVYGAVSDVSRPLIYKMNQARMSASTFSALRELLVWAISTLDEVVSPDLDEHLAHEGLPSYSEAMDAENRLAESSPTPQTDTPEGTDEDEQEKHAGEAPKAPADEIVPLTAETMPDSDEDIAAEAEVAAAIAAESAAEEAAVAAPAPRTVRKAKPQ